MKNTSNGLSKPKGKQRRVSLGDGLVRLDRPGGTSSWVCRVQKDGVRRDFGLGSCQKVSLAQARELAQEIREQVEIGIDPHFERRKRQAVPTFIEAAAKTYEIHSKTWRNGKHHAQWTRTLELYAFPHIGKFKVDQINGPMIRDLLAEIWLAKPETARRVRQRVGAVLDWAYASGYRDTEPHTSKGYRSDFDLLIIVNDKRLTEKVDFWGKLEDRLIRELAIDKTLKTPVNFIVHTLQEVNDGLAHGRYFFMDVARDGIALYEYDDKPLHTPKPKTPEQALAMAREYFDEWMPTAQYARTLAGYSLKDGQKNYAAFNLHQATERLYHCVLLVCTFYTPHVHNLAFLRTQAERIDMRLVDAWPRERREERTRFEKLKEAYVKARYSKHYRITEEELTWLGGCVEELGRAVHAICSERIAALEANASIRP